MKERDPITDRDIFGSLRRSPNRLSSTGFVGSRHGNAGPLLRSHGSVYSDSRLILYPMKFQHSPATGCAGSYRKETFRGSGKFLLLSGSLLGTWAHLADKSSRSRLCCLQLFPVLFTDHFTTAHYPSFSIVVVAS